MKVTENNRKNQAMNPLTKSQIEDEISNLRREIAQRQMFINQYEQQLRAIDLTESLVEPAGTFDMTKPIFKQDAIDSVTSVHFYT